MAMRSSISEALWLRQLLIDIQSPQKSPKIIFCDNQSAIALVSTSKFHDSTKHISIRYHFIQDSVAQGSIKIQLCPTSNNILTKSISSN